MSAKKTKKTTTTTKHLLPMARFVEEMAKVGFQDEDDEIFEARDLIHVGENEQFHRRC